MDHAGAGHFPVRAGGALRGGAPVGDAAVASGSSLCGGGDCGGTGSGTGAECVAGAGTLGLLRDVGERNGTDMSLVFTGLVWDLRSSGGAR